MVGDQTCDAFVDADCPEPTRAIECVQAGVHESGVITDVM
jgi:hypothetical protein